MHVDYSERDEPEHKVERNLALGRGLNEPHASVKDSVPSFESHNGGKRDAAAASTSAAAFAGGGSSR